MIKFDEEQLKYVVKRLIWCVVFIGQKMGKNGFHDAKTAADSVAGVP